MGLLCRVFVDIDGNWGRDVDAVFGPSDVFGVALVEIGRDANVAGDIAPIVRGVEQSEATTEK